MIILTGGAGFIGSCILKSLNDSGFSDILIVDHVEEDDRKVQNLENKRYLEYEHKSDFIKRIREDTINQKVDCVIHMGACSSTTMNDPQYYQTNNYEYTKSLAHWCMAHDVRFIYASSAATYGDGSMGFSDEDEATLKLKPLNLYGKSKHDFDLEVLVRGWGSRFVGLKFFNVFGPNEYHKGPMRSVILTAYPKMVQEGKIRLFKSYRNDYAHGEQKRDFIYIKDAVDVVIYFFKNRNCSGIFNVGTGQARSWNELARAMFQAVNMPVNIEYFDMPDNMRKKYQYFTQADTKKLIKAGYPKPFTSLEGAVADYIDYLQTNRHI